MRAVRWAAATAVVGLAAGLVSLALALLSVGAEGLYREQPAFLAVLPLVGVATVALYKRLKIPFDTDAPNVLDRLRGDRPVNGTLVAGLLVCVPLANLGGCSVGREAAGLQMGAALVGPLARVAGGREGDARILMMAGMAAMVGSLLYTPLAAAVFVVEICHLKRAEVLDARLLAVPCAAAIAYAVTSAFSVGRIEIASVACPDVPLAWGTAALVGAACAALGLAFVFCLKSLRTACIKLFDNLYARILVGAALAMALTLVAGTTDAAGTGGPVVTRLFAGDAPAWWMWALKFALTAICLAFGFKGGAIMPLPCVGACAGCALGQALGLPVLFAAAVGMTACIASAARSPFGGFVMALEFFGFAGAPYFALASLCGAVAARRDSLYGGIAWTLDPRRWAFVRRFVERHKAARR